VALELLRQPHIDVRSRRVLVEVEEGPASAVEDTAAALGQAVDLPKVGQHRLERVESPGAGVAHGSIMPSYARRVETPVTIAFVGYAEADRADAASAYEDEVLPLLADHGATLLYRGCRADQQDPSLPLEVHLIRFASRAGYDAFLADDRRRALIDEHGEVFTSKVVVELDTVTER
jgi:uncharacterized protein (DUF1330 family)